MADDLRRQEQGASGVDPSPSDWTASQARSAPASAPAGMAFAPGTVLAGRYRVVAPLGRGGMGEVFRAEDTKLGQPVALKFVRERLSPVLLERLYAEVRIGRQISHPNVCRLYDVAEFEGHTCLVMEYVDGEDLASLLSRIGRLPADKALEIARDLAAGLAAVHEKGVVHRDLKPANVMIDGRGRARLTDFGLAHQADVAARDGAGTPAYMSPEQIAGAEVTARSDVYAFGLILYETLTGRRFFDARTAAELVSQHRLPKRERLQEAARSLDPPVQRVLVQCLEEEPSARPHSARALLAALPATDPLDAAVAAGETPSPEMVAAAARTGELSPAKAWALLLSVVAGFAGFAWLLDASTFVSESALPKAPPVLADRARQILERLGHPEGLDAAYGFEPERAYVRWVRRHDRSPERWIRLRRSLPPVSFFYRQSPRLLVATNRDGEVRRDDPPLDLAGMAGVVLDPGGRLTTFIAVPPRVEESGPGPAPDWAALFLEAGLEPDRFRPVPPAWTAPVDSDSKAAWLGVHPSQPDLPLRVEAAAYHGRPVWFALLPPWAAAADDGPSVSPTPVGQVAVWILALAMPLGGAILARRNLRLGRGDAKGGLRVALFIFASYGLARLFRTNHVPSFADELWILVKVFAYPSFWAIQAWLLYLALEPYARRRWPHVLISWKRLLEGRYRDPLVGRDLLVGSLAGILLAIGFQAFAVVPVWFGKAGITPIPYVVGTALSSYSEVLFRLFVNQYSAVFFAMVFLFLLVVTRMLVRSTWLAVLACCLLLAGPLQGENVAIEWLAGACRAVMMIGVLTLGGLLPLAVALLVMFSVGEVPISLDPSAWYAAHALPALAFLGGLAVYGFRTSLAGRSPFGGTLDD